jgi:hypothetical protein
MEMVLRDIEALTAGVGAAYGGRAGDGSERAPALTEEALASAVEVLDDRCHRLRSAYDAVVKDSDLAAAGSDFPRTSEVFQNDAKEAEAMLLLRLRESWRGLERVVYEAKCRLYEAVWMQ